MDVLIGSPQIEAVETPAPAPGSAPVLERVLIAAAVISAAIVVVVGIGRPIWLDEANSVQIAAQAPAGILDSLSRDNNLPFFYFVLSFWMRCFGDSEIAIRSLTALLYLGGCGAACALGHRVGGTRSAAWYSGFFYLASALAIRQAHNVRMYSLLGLLSALSTIGFLRLFWQRDRSAKAWAFYVAINAVGLLTHVWFVFVLFAQFVVLAASAWRDLWRWAAAAAVAVVPFGVLWGRAFAGQMQNGATNWMPKLSLNHVLVAALEFYYPVATLIFLFLAIALLRIHGHRGMVLLGAIFAVSLATPLLVSLFRPIYWPGRYTIIALPPLAACLGCVLSRHLPRRALSGLCLLLLFVQVPSYVRARDTAPDTSFVPNQTDRLTAQFLLANAAPGDSVIFTSLTRAAADYYFHRAQASNRFAEISFPREVATHQGWIEMNVTPARRAALEIEADEILREVQSVAARGGGIWLYEGYGVEISGILKQRLDRTLLLRREHPLQGPFHKRLLEYRARVTPE